MDEEEKKQGTPENPDEGSEPKAASLIESAYTENQRMEKNIKEMREENDRKEEIAAKQMLSGTAEAGQTAEPKEETSKEYRERIDKEMAEGKYD